MSIKVKYIIYFLASLIIIKPEFFSYIPIINSFYNYAQIIVFIIVLFISIFSKKINRDLAPFLIMYFIWFVITLINEGNLRSLLMYSFPAITFLLFINIGLNDDKESFFSACSFAFRIYAYINLITIIIYPEGMYALTFSENWFLGFRNPQIRFLLPTLLFTYISDFLKYNKLSFRSILFSIVVITTILLNKSSTSIVGVFVFFSFFLLLYKINLNKLFNFKKLLIIVISLTIIIVFLQKTNIFEFIIVDLLHKDITLTGRFRIWKVAIELLPKSYIHGIGFLSGDDFHKLFLTAGGAVHPHNYILYQIMNFGLVGILPIIYIFTICDKYRVGINKYALMTYITIFSFMVMSLTESLTQAPLFYSLFLIYIFFSKQGQEKKHD